MRIAGYERYEVFEDGSIKNDKNRMLKPYLSKRGYYRVKLYDLNGYAKMFQVHRLVAQAFIPNPNNLPEVNHIDGNKQNNSVENLEWCTSEENQKHAEKLGLRKNCYGNNHSKLTNEHKKRLKQAHYTRAIKCMNTGEIFKGIKNVAEHFGLTQSQVAHNLYGDTQLANNKYKFLFIEEE